MSDGRAQPRGAIQIRSLPRQTTWVDRAACAGKDPATWFIVEKTANYAAARQVCRRCPVRSECLEWALAANETEGFWGGLSPVERYELGRRRRAQAREAGHADLNQLLYLIILVLFIIVLLRILGVRV